ncbi:MAG: DUF5752 family protein [Nanoarchaeota archaeon]|nr:DUF5752 family protein [Nanoarchaeota archaeon]
MEKEEAQRILRDANPEQCFWVNNGPVLKNLDGLSKALAEMNKDAFKHHANKEKNDFSSWVRDILGDQKLAEDIAKIKSKSAIAAKVKQRLQQLKKIAA